MLSTRIIAAAFGAATLLGAAMSTAPASAAPISAGTAFGAGAETGLVQQAWHRGRPHYGRRYHAPRRYYRPRCWTESRRVWNGYRWIRRPVRVCR
ncbi:hypothetical protein [Bosea sp. ANAM02]|uniref:hypothetical protein n=1 Tax=Bosea sp. ANAM02 TaxID=2020412 RepID=UPI0006480095|nr:MULTISPECIES: hypothetical protein [Hyphomicrobiales]BCB20794.1 hypothetical protein OCUBac02_36880 [Bosea sp. ANAM02]